MWSPATPVSFASLTNEQRAGPEKGRQREVSLPGARMYFVSIVEEDPKARAEACAEACARACRSSSARSGLRLVQDGQGSGVRPTGQALAGSSRSGPLPAAGMQAAGGLHLLANVPSCCSFEVLVHKNTALLPPREWFELSLMDGLEIGTGGCMWFSCIDVP